LSTYGLFQVSGDRYACEWPREAFKKNNVDYRPSNLTKSDLYLELLPAINGGRVQLLDHKVMRTQLVRLERRTARSGKDSIDHPPGGRDDVANAVAGALVNELRRGQRVSVDPRLLAQVNDELTNVSGWNSELGERIESFTVGEG